MNEEGTEAAAATGVMMTLSGPLKPTASAPVFRGDRPFVFAIRDRSSGVLLFLGRMTDPTRR